MRKYWYNPDPPAEPEISWNDECEIALLGREIAEYREQIDALEAKDDANFTDADSDEIFRLELWIKETQSEIDNIYERYGIAA